MNRLKKLIPAMLVILLSLLLVDCSCTKQEVESTPAESTETAAESSARPAESTEPVQTGPAGEYEISAMVTDGKETSSEDLALMKNKGLNCILVLNSDGTGVLDLFGEKSDLTWDENTVSASGKTYQYTCRDGLLTLTNGTSSLTFTRTD